MRRWRFVCTVSDRYTNDGASRLYPDVYKTFAGAREDVYVLVSGKTRSDAFRNVITGQTHQEPGWVGMARAANQLILLDYWIQQKKRKVALMIQRWRVRLGCEYARTSPTQPFGLNEEDFTTLYAYEYTFGGERCDIYAIIWAFNEDEAIWSATNGFVEKEPRWVKRVRAAGTSLIVYEAEVIRCRP